MTLKCLPRMEADVYAHGSAHQAFRHLGEVHCPVTVALGDEAVPPAAFGRAVAAALPQGRVASLPALGHFGPLEDPVAVAGSILASFADDHAGLS